MISSAICSSNLGVNSANGAHLCEVQRVHLVELREEHLLEGRVVDELARVGDELTLVGRQLTTAHVLVQQLLCV